MLSILSTVCAFAGPSRTTYQAKIIKPDGYPLEATNVNFKFTILDPSGSCILYTENFSAVNMGSSGGLVSFSLGSGVRTYPVSGSTFEQVFSNTTASLICDSNVPATYPPQANDTRKILMQFNDGAGWQTLPAMTINAVPYAMYANDAQKFNGKDVIEFVQVASLPTTCGVSEALRFNGAGFSCIPAGGTGTITSASVIAALGYVPVDGASVTTVTAVVGSVSTTVASVSSTLYSVSNAVTSLQSSIVTSFAALTSSQWVTSGTHLHYTSGEVGIGTTTPYAKLDVSGGIRISMDTATCAVSNAGTLRYNSGNVEFCNGFGWNTFGTDSVTSASVISALGYTPVDATSVSASVSSLSISIATSFTDITSNISSVSSSVTSLASTVSAITSSQWVSSPAGMFATATVTSTSFSPAGQLGTQNSVPSSGGVDDGFYTFTLPFAVSYNGTSYTTIHISTNSYATFSSGSSQFSGLSAASPALEKIMIDARDRSSNSVWFFSDATSFSIRYEGGCGTAPGTNLVWELKGSSSNPNQLQLQVISLCGAGFSTVAGASTELQTISPTAGTGYLINQVPSPESIRYTSGNVGIGTTTPNAKLEVSGSIRVGMDLASCSVNFAGALRYNSGSMELCNGNSWLSINAGAMTSSTVVAALGYTPADVVSVSSTVSSLTTNMSTSFTSVTNNINSVSSSLSFLSSSVGAIKSSQWSNFSTGSTFNTVVTSTGFSPLGQLGTQNTVPTSGGQDDGFYTFNLPFTIGFNGVSYTTIYIGTNSYATFGSGTNVYSSLSVANPALNKIMINSADRSSNSIWYYSDATSFSIRYEGGCGTSPSNAMVWELQGSSANPNQLKLQIVSVCAGGISTVANTTTQLQSITTNAGSAYLIDYAVGADSIYYSGNVSIGTSTPSSARVDVVHGANATYGLRLKSTTSSTVGGLLLENDTGNNALIQVPRSGASATLAGHMLLQAGNKDIIFNSSAGAERLRILSTGNIGIGTSTPVASLDVSGGVRIGMQAVTCNAGLAGTLRYNTSNVEFCNGSSWQAFNTSGVTSSTVTAALGSATLVGIGTNSPTSTLDVSGTVKISGGSPGAGKVLTSDASGNATWQTVSGDNLGNHTATQNLNLGTYKLVGNGGSEGIMIDAVGNVRLGPIGGSVGLTMGPATSTSGSTWGSIAAGFNSTASSISSYAFGSYARATNWYGFATGNNTTAGGKSSAVFGQNITVNGDYSVGFGLSSSVSYTANTPSTMVIMGGNVGIGTTTPAYRLSLYEGSGTVVSNIESGNNGSAVYTRTTGKTSGGVTRTMGSGFNISDSNGNFEIYDFTAGLSRLYVNSNGNVGIGTTMPQGRFVISDTFYAAYLSMRNVTSAVSAGGLAHGVTLGWGSQTSGPSMRLVNSNSTYNDAGMAFSVFNSSTEVEAMRIENNGRVGIGTSAPATTLHVRGGTSYGALMLGDNGGTSNHHLTHETDGSFGIFTGTFGSGVRQFIINSAGWMGIGLGNNQPGATLHVSGTARFTDGNQAAGRVLASDVSGNASWKQTIIHGTIASVGNSSTAVGNRVSSGVSITLPPGRWQISGMGITTGASCRADFGLRTLADAVVKYTLMPSPDGDFQTAAVMAYVDIATTTTYELYISSRGACTSQIHVDNSLWELTATGVAY